MLQVFIVQCLVVVQAPGSTMSSLRHRLISVCRESFFANCRVRGGYSGVGPFCRAGSCMPVAALDGFSGVLPQTLAKPKDLPPPTPVQEALSNPCSALFER